MRMRVKIEDWVATFFCKMGAPPLPAALLEDTTSSMVSTLMFFKFLMSDLMARKFLCSSMRSHSAFVAEAGILA